MANIFKWIAWLIGAGLAIYGIVLMFFSIIGLILFCLGLILFCVGVAIHLLADIHLRVGLMYDEHWRQKKTQEEKVIQNAARPKHPEELTPEQLGILIEEERRAQSGAKSGEEPV